jgi:DNA repair protein RecO (recombination protein O)
MAIQKSQGILLRRQDLRETSIILTFYTRSFGKIRGIVRGVRGPRGQFGGGALEIAALDDLVFYERRRSDIYTVSQCDLVEYFSPLRGSLDRLSYAAYMAELMDSVTSLGDADEAAFDLLHKSLKLLCEEASPRRVARIFEIKLLFLMGLMPSMGRCASCGSDAGASPRFSYMHGGIVCGKCAGRDAGTSAIMPGTIRFIEHILQAPFEMAGRVKVAEPVGRELEKILRRFLDHHIERRLKTVEFIKETEG